MISTSILLMTQGFALASAAPAETGTRPPDNDPNQIVCVRETPIGSRVATRRVCRTRAEWAEHQREYRESVQRAQNQTQTQCVQTASMAC